MRRFALGLAVVTVLCAGSSWCLADDQVIAQAIVEKLRQHQSAGELKGFDIDLNVENGKVTLSGNVSNENQHSIAIDAARYVPGVKLVVNDLKIGGEKHEHPAQQQTLSEGLNALFGSSRSVAAEEEATETFNQPEAATAAAAPRSNAQTPVAKGGQSSQAQQPKGLFAGLHSALAKKPQSSGNSGHENGGAMQQPRSILNAMALGRKQRAARPDTAGRLSPEGLHESPDSATDSHASNAPLTTDGIRQPASIPQTKAFPVASNPQLEAESDDIAKQPTEPVLSYAAQPAEADPIATLPLAQNESVRKEAIDNEPVIDGESPKLSFQAQPSREIDEEVQPVHETSLAEQQAQMALTAPLAQPQPPIDNDATAMGHQQWLQRQARKRSELKVASHAGHRPHQARPAAARSQQLAPPRIPQAAGQFVPQQLYMVPPRQGRGVSPVAFAASTLPGSPRHAPRRRVRPAAMLAAPLAAPIRMAQAAQPQPIQPAPQFIRGTGGGVAPVRYDHPHMPGYAWPSYASYPNYAALQYPKHYSAHAWPYCGPFYPYPQVPLGWRKVTLSWDDGWWFLDFKDKGYGPYVTR